MPEDQSTTSEVYNVAFLYSHDMIFNCLVMFDKLSTVALYGAEDMEISLNMLENYKVDARIQALSRMYQELKKVFGNSEFKVRTKKQDEKEFIELEKNLDEFDKFKEAISKPEYNEIEHTKKIIINEKHFSLSWNTLTKIRRSLIPLLNNAGFIYRTLEDLTKESVADKFINQG